jgi:Rrf2 family protein
MRLPFNPAAAMLSRTAEYALRAVVYLASHTEGSKSADHLALATKVPRRYLYKVLQDLVHGKLLRSQPGPGGGYSLLETPCDITILDVVNAVAPLERIRCCPLGLSTHKQLCPLHAELDKAYAATERAFGRVTIDRLFHSTSKIIPLCEHK